MSDIECPYCRHEQEINHDDGYGYGDGIEYSQDCTSCGQEFKFVPSFSISYDIFCNGEHDMAQSPVEKHRDLWSCTRCDHYELRK